MGSREIDYSAPVIVSGQPFNRADKIQLVDPGTELIARSLRAPKAAADEAE